MCAHSGKNLGCSPTETGSTTLQTLSLMLLKHNDCMSESPAPQWRKPGRFEALGPAFFTYLQPTPVPEPHWIAASVSTAEAVPVWMNEI